MLEFLTKFFRREEASKSLAKERLRLVLMSDRVSLAPDIFDTMKGEMLDVVRRYLEVDERSLDLRFENAERRFMLLANIPVLNVKTRFTPATVNRPSEKESTKALDLSHEGAHGNGTLTGPAHTPSRRRRAATAELGTGNEPRPKRRRRRRRKPSADPAAGGDLNGPADQATRPEDDLGR